LRRKIVAQKGPLPDADTEKQRPLERPRKTADQAGPLGQQPHEVAEEAHMKRQQKSMHEQDNK